MVCLVLAVGSALGMAGHLCSGSLGTVVAWAGAALSVTAGAQVSRLPRIKALTSKRTVLWGTLQANLAMATLNGLSPHGVPATATATLTAFGAARGLLADRTPSRAERRFRQALTRARGAIRSCPADHAIALSRGSGAWPNASS